MQIYNTLEEVRDQAPIVHHLTNWVTIYDCANIVKVFGASPVMAHSSEEVEEMAGIASALVLNIGTLTSRFVASMKRAAKVANEKGIPVVLDVCGAGATTLRNTKAAELINETKIDIIKGNASEVASVAGFDAQTKGVDSGEVKEDLKQVAQNLAKEKNCTVVITGKEDIVADSENIYLVKNGDILMSKIVGTGCMAASVIGTFAAVESNLAKASVSALSCFGIAAEIAAEASSGVGTFKEKLFDAAHSLTQAQVAERQKVEKIEE